MNKSTLTVIKDIIIIAFAGIPFGWRWASKITTAITLKGIGIKFLISVFLGCIALFLVVGTDVLKCVAEIVGKVRAKKQIA